MSTRQGYQEQVGKVEKNTYLNPILGKCGSKRHNPPVNIFEKTDSRNKTLICGQAELLTRYIRK
jgi:hypothetical protein